MKLAFLFLTFVISIHSFTQSKKEQIVILNSRLDSLNTAYVKDTILLGKTIRKIDGDKNTIMGLPIKKIQEYLNNHI